MADESTWREREQAGAPRGVLLDPLRDIVAGVTAYPTVYAPDHLVISGDPSRALELLNLAARAFGWSVRPVQIRDDHYAGREGARSTALTRADIVRDADSDRDEPVDAWRLLQRTRRIASRLDRIAGDANAGGIEPVRTFGRRLPLRPFPRVPKDDPLRSVGLDHVVSVDEILVGRYARTNPASVDRYARTNPLGDLDSYSSPGTGGLEVVTYVGVPPKAQHEVGAGRRPVVVVVDTGCGPHAWLRAKGADPDPGPWVSARWPSPTPPKVVGVDEAGTDPEIFPDQTGPRDGHLDSSSGHGTFVAGLVRQAGPDANIIAARVADSDGTVLEIELMEALEELIVLLDSGALEIDVVNLSLGYYHETPQDGLFSTGLYDILVDLRSRGIVVVVSAGNDATDRPTFPAALWAGSDPSLGLGPEPAGLAPHLSVGALNPSGRSVALYSNIGPWVRLYAPGTSVLSTLPPFQGGLAAPAREDLYGLPRKMIDPDDFRGGFAIWSGTSFAAPYVAGLIAQSMAEQLTSTGTRAIPTFDDVVSILSAENWSIWGASGPPAGERDESEA
jgi:subtilisin family serine protease